MTGHSDDHGVPDDQTVDEPFPVASHGADGGGAEPLPSFSKEPSPGQKHGWWVENFKNVAALGIIVVCLGLVAAFSYVEFRDGGSTGGNPLSRASDVFKLIATTALGYLFGRNNDHGS